VQKGKELNDFQRNPLDIEILSNLRFGSLEVRDTSVTKVTNKNLRQEVPLRVEPERDRRRPVEEQAVESRAVRTVEREVWRIVELRIAF
jgi:hypothetical protein